jgi:hypothetical protein
MTFQDLTNEEVLFLFHEINQELHRYNEILETKKVRESVELFDYGQITVDYILTNDEVEDLSRDRHYLFVVSLHKKLELITSMISEADPSLASKVEVSFQKRF